MQTVLYDGSWEGFLCAVFDVYDYKFKEADICSKDSFQGNILGSVHHARMDPAHSTRVWAGLQRILSGEACEAIYRTFLSELYGTENMLLAYIQYAFKTGGASETDFGNSAVLYVTQTAKKVWREKHRMEAFVRFQKTADDLYYALIEPDHNVLPLIAPHFQTRYADQRWMIYDAQRRYGIYHDGEKVEQVEIDFNEQTGGGTDVTKMYDSNETMYQVLWQQYFKSVNIAARKNTKLHIKHMPRRYWKHLTEKKPQPNTSIQPSSKKGAKEISIHNKSV